MMRALFDVVRGEGVASAFRRAQERITEAALRIGERFTSSREAAIVNVAAGSIAARSGGVAIQLIARLRAERALRDVVLLHANSVRALAHARAIHLEGTAGAPLADVVRLCESGVPVVVSVHDFSLFSASPHLFEPWLAPEPAQRAHRELARRLLESATAVIFPSRFLRDRHRELFGLALATGSEAQSHTQAA
jgi:hypothetical protein